MELTNLIEPSSSRAEASAPKEEGLETPLVQKLSSSTLRGVHNAHRLVKKEKNEAKRLVEKEIHMTNRSMKMLKFTFDS